MMFFPPKDCDEPIVKEDEETEAIHVRLIIDSNYIKAPCHTFVS